MAEAIATAMATNALGALGKKLSDVLSSELSMARNVRQDVEFIDNELRRIKAFLWSADAKVETDAEVRAWVKQINELAYDTEDLIDEFKVHVAKPRRQGLIMGCLANMIQLFKKWREQHEIFAQLQEIKDRIKRAKESTSHYGLQPLPGPIESASTTEELTDPGLAALFVEEKELVGIDEPREHLIEWLLHGSKSLRVISVVAMGGMGKTALVKKVYDSPKVRISGHFDCHAWITLSKKYNFKELLRNMFKQLSDREEEDSSTVVEVHRAGTGSLVEPYISSREIREMEKKRAIETADEPRLIEMLRDYLKDKRYVVVFDELWSINAWESIKNALPDNGLGSRVVITTRNTEIAEIASSFYCAQNDRLVYSLGPLTPEDSWTLFCKRTFGSKDNLPQNLEELSQKIVKKCGGLPLAIVTIGSLLAAKPKTVEQWRKLHDRLGSEMETNPTLASIMRILSLSYEDLPYHLKLCFLYLSIFPEDYPISRGRLLRLWMGEGFVDAKPQMTVEETADEYFDELVKRSMIQVTETDPSGRARTCKVHDIMREVIISRSREESFFYSLVDPSAPRPTMDKVRRLTTQCAVHQPLNMSFAHLRSLVLFGVFVSSSLKFAKLLRVLDVQGQDIGPRFMPQGSQLQNLRYLSLRGTRIAQLPEDLGMLQNLETLDLRDSSIGELPAGIVKLRRLRYLAVYYAERTSTATMAALRRRGVSMPRGIGRLTELCTLVLVDAEPGFIEELKELQRLRRLGVTQLTAENEGHFWATIENMGGLRSLTADSKEDDLKSSMASVQQLPPQLRSLKLYGLVVEEFPRHIALLEYLAKMVLSGTKLRNDPFPILQSLPSLSELRLFKDAYVGKELHSWGGFNKLRTMHLVHLGELELVTVKEKAMPIVESLRIKGCGRGWSTIAGRTELRLEGFRANLIDRDVQ